MKINNLIVDLICLLVEKHETIKSVLCQDVVKGLNNSMSVISVI